MNHWPVMLAGEGTPLQAVIFGVVWTTVSACAAVWPRRVLVLSERWWRWTQNGGDGPTLGTRPKVVKEWAPSDRLVAGYRLLAVAYTLFGLFLTSQGLRRM